MPRRANFKKSSSFRDLLERRKAAGLGTLAPEADTVNIEFEPSDGPTDVAAVAESNTNATYPPTLNGDGAVEAHPASGDRDLPMFRDFDHPDRQNADDFDEDYPVHDQLPSAEELKMALQINSGRSWLLRRRCSRWMCIAGVVVTICLFAATVVRSPKRLHEIQQNINPGRIEQVIQLLIANGASSEISLRVTEDAQRRAAVYIAAGDAFSATWPDDPNMAQRLVERFTLATVYYGMNGQNWNYRLKFLEAIDHCDW